MSALAKVAPEILKRVLTDFYCDRIAWAEIPACLATQHNQQYLQIYPSYSVFGRANITPPLPASMLEAFAYAYSRVSLAANSIADCLSLLGYVRAGGREVDPDLILAQFAQDSVGAKIVQNWKQAHHTNTTPSEASLADKAEIVQHILQGVLSSLTKEKLRIAAPIFEGTPNDAESKYKRLTLAEYADQVKDELKAEYQEAQNQVSRLLDGDAIHLVYVDDLRAALQEYAPEAAEGAP